PTRGSDPRARPTRLVVSPVPAPPGVLHVAATEQDNAGEWAVRRGSWQCLRFNGKHRGQVTDDRCPTLPGIGCGIHLPTGGAEVDTTVLERVHRHGVTQHVDVAVFLRQPLCQGFPLVPAGTAAVDPQSAFRREVVLVAGDRYDIHGLGFVSMDGDRESEVAGEIATDFVPGSAGIVRAHD